MMKPLKVVAIMLSAMLVSFSTAHAAGATKTSPDNPVLKERHETAEQHDARMAWWREAKFGMFVHWGLYAQAGGVWIGKDSPGSYKEWIMYSLIDNVAIQFAK